MYDYIVVGAGILGASTAYHLAKQGVSVAIVDRNDSGQATNAAAGIICPWLTNRRNKAWYRLVINGANYYPALISELEDEGEISTGYNNCGAINIFDTDQKLDKKIEIARKRRCENPEMGQITRLTPKETRELFPPLAEQYGAVHISGAARVNGQAMRDALIYSAQKHGAKCIEGDATLIKSGSSIDGVVVNNNIHHAEKVIVTSGVWARKLIQPLGMTFHVTSQKAQIVHLHLPNTITADWPVVIPPYNQYILAFEHGKIVIGTTHEDNKGFDNRATVSAVQSIIDKALRVAPGLANSTYIQTKVGFRPFTPGSLPVFGSVPGVDSLVIANGLGASGLTSGPYLGAELAKYVLEESTELPFEDYNVSGALSF